MKRVLNLIFACALLTFIASVSVYGASSIDVSPNDVTYHYLDQLIAHDLIHTAIVGQRPYSRGEVARLIAEAKRNWDKRKEEIDISKMSLKENRRWVSVSSWINKILKVLEKDYRRELAKRKDYKGGEGIKKAKWLELHVMDKLEFLFTYLDSNAKTFPVNNGVGSISAMAQPLVQNRQGRDYVDGPQYSIETEHWMNVTRYSSFYVRPRFQMQFPSASPNDSVHAIVQELYGVFNIYNVELQIGRSSLIEGQGIHGGLFISDHARPLDHIQISNDHPIVLPWIFKYLGQNKFMAFFATLGPESFFPNTIFAGYKWTIKPFKVWELGMANMVMIGGDGAPSFSFGNFIGDFIGFSGTGGGKSNRILGFDTRITLPFLRNTQLYAEFFLDDMSTAGLKKTFIDDAAYYVGFYIPRLNYVGNWHGRLEFRYLSERFYRHSQFKSGYTLNREILGDPLGPDGHSITVTIGWDVNPKTLLDVNFFYEVSDSDDYLFLGSSIRRSQDNPAETRLRWILNFQQQFNNRFTLLGRFGYERVHNFNYVSGDNRNQFLVEVGLTFNFRDYFTLVH